VPIELDAQLLMEAIAADDERGTFGCHAGGSSAGTVAILARLHRSPLREIGEVFSFHSSFCISSRARSSLSLGVGTLKDLGEGGRDTRGGLVLNNSVHSF